MKRITLTVLAVASLACAFFIGTRFPHVKPKQDNAAISQQVEEDPDRNIRTELAADGTHSFWIRSEDGSRIDQYLFNSSSGLIGRKSFRLHPDGNPVKCKIYDDTKTEIYKIRYGYRTSDGMLVEEQVFDSQINRVDKNTGGELPLRRVIYTHEPGISDPKIIVIDAEDIELTNNLVSAFRNPFATK
jgi:hypothetical protein